MFTFYKIRKNLENRWETYGESREEELLSKLLKVLGFILLVIAVITDYIQIFGFFSGALMAFAFPAVCRCHLRPQSISKTILITKSCDCNSKELKKVIGGIVLWSYS